MFKMNSKLLLLTLLCATSMVKAFSLLDYFKKTSSQTESPPPNSIGNKGSSQNQDRSNQQAPSVDSFLNSLYNRPSLYGGNSKEKTATTKASPDDTTPETTTTTTTTTSTTTTTTTTTSTTPAPANDDRSGGQGNDPNGSWMNYFFGRPSLYDVASHQDRDNEDSENENPASLKFAEPMAQKLEQQKKDSSTQQPNQSPSSPRTTTQETTASLSASASSLGNIPLSASKTSEGNEERKETTTIATTTKPKTNETTNTSNSVSNTTSEPAVHDKPYDDIEDEWFEANKTVNKTISAHSNVTGLPVTNIPTGNVSAWVDSTHVHSTNQNVSVGNQTTTRSTTNSSENSGVNGDVGSLHSRTTAEQCHDVNQFLPCAYYQSCFRDSQEDCAGQVDYLGDDFSQACLGDMDPVVRTTSSQELAFYLTLVQQCVNVHLLAVLRDPTCDAISTALITSLLTESRDSCLYQGGLFCEVISSPVTADDLASMFEGTPQSDNFKMRLLINFGDISSYCQPEVRSSFMVTLMAAVMPEKGQVVSSPVPDS